METTHENSRFRSQLLEKTSVLKSALLARLKSQFLPSATATVATDSGITLTHVKTEGVIPPSLPKNRERDYFLNQLKIQPIDTQPLITSQNSNCKDSSQLEKINQLPVFDSFNCIAKVAVTGNNLKQERQNLFTTVLQHHTLVDVFLCLSFASCLFAGELRLAALWWGGHRNKPLGANTVCRCCNGSEPPYRPIFRANNQNIITRQKGTTK